MRQTNKLFLLLALLLTAATGAWADETPLLTIENKDYTSFKSGSKTFDDKVTITFSNEVKNDGDGDGWWSNVTPSLLTVTGINGYTITSCKFYTQGGIAKNGYTVEGESPSVYLHAAQVYTDDSKLVNIGSAGITKIEVYGAAAATGYTVSMKDGVKDADKWTVKVGDGQAQALPIGGLKGDGSETVTLQYNGRLKVKGVKATSDAAAASVPDGALSGVFSVSSTKKVYFSKGNLRYASSKWSFFDNQYDYYESYSADAWDKFGWSTSANTYGMNTSTSSSAYSGDFVDWGATMGAGWFTLSSDEWAYLINTRTVNGGTGDGKSYTRGQSVNGKLGFVIYPDNYTGDVYSGSDWATFESAGCVFLPAAGLRAGSSVYYPGTGGYYWSASPYVTVAAYSVYFASGELDPADNYIRGYGCSVRLVREVAASDAPAAVSLIVNPVVGQIIGSDGKNYDANATLPTGVTKVAVIAYVGSETGDDTYKNGLAIALADEAQSNWSTAVSTCGAKTAITGAKWCLPSHDQWKQMFKANGGNDASYTDLNTTITTAGGTTLQGDAAYWSSSESSPGVNAYFVYLDSGSAEWYSGTEGAGNRVRACLAF